MGSNIYIFTSSYKPILGGLQTVCAQLAETLVSRGEKVVVITSLRRKAPKPLEVINGVTVIRLHYECKMLTLFLLKLLFFFKRPEKVYVHSPLDECFFVRKLRHCFNFKLASCFHGHDVMTYDEGYSTDSELYRNQRGLIDVSDRVSACSKYLANVVERVFFINNVAHVYNGADISRFEHRMNSPYANPFIFAFGRLEVVKGFDLLIKAFANVENRDDIHLLIAGDGTQHKALTSLIKELKLEKKVFLIGRKSQEEIVAYTQNAVVLAISSLNEAFGIVAVEAIAAKRPVLATNVGGLPEILDRRFGMLVEPSVEGLRSGLEAILAKVDTFDFSLANAYLRQFTLDNMVDNYLALLNNDYQNKKNAN